MLAEVQHPDYHEAHPRHGDPLSRLRFYDRFDALIIDVPYYQPALSAGLQPVYGLLLLALYVRPDLINPARTYLDPPENLLFALRSLLYADGDPDEAAAAALLSAASVSRVRLVPTSDYAPVTPGLPRRGEHRPGPEAPRRESTGGVPSGQRRNHGITTGSFRDPRR